MMDIKVQAKPLRKKLEKIIWQLQNDILTEEQTEKKEEEKKAL